MKSVTMNAFALGALTVLRGANNDLNDVQQEVNSGLAIGKAADDPTYWSMATTMRSDSASLQTVSDAMTLGSGQVDTANTGMEAVINVLAKFTSTLASAKEPGVDRTALNQALQGYKDTLQSAIQGASFAGDNWLYNTDPTAETTKSVISGFTRGPGGQIHLNTVDYDSSQSLLVDTYDPSRGLLTKNVDANTINSDHTTTPRNYYLMAPGGGGTPSSGTEISVTADTTDQQINDMISVVNALSASVTSATAKMGVMQDRIDQQSQFVANLQDSIDTGVKDLVDVDMDEASARLTASQTSQQVALQGLSIANTMASKVLILLQQS